MDEQVTSTQKLPEQQTKPAATSYTNTRPVILVGLVMLLVGLVIGYLVGFFMFSPWNKACLQCLGPISGNSKQVVLPTKTQRSSLISSPSLSASIQSDWKAYDNSEVGLHLQYPTNWTITRGDFTNLNPKNTKKFYSGGIVWKTTNQQEISLIVNFQGDDICIEEGSRGCDYKEDIQTKTGLSFSKFYPESSITVTYFYKSDNSLDKTIFVQGPRSQETTIDAVVRTISL